MVGRDTTVSWPQMYLYTRGGTLLGHKCTSVLGEGSRWPLTATFATPTTAPTAPSTTTLLLLEQVLSVACPLLQFFMQCSKQLGAGNSSRVISRFLRVALLATSCLLSPCSYYCFYCSYYICLCYSLHRCYLCLRPPAIPATVNSTTIALLSPARRDTRVAVLATSCYPCHC